MATPLPKGLHHLESTVKHKFVNRFSRRVMPQKAFVQPKDRISRWNIYEGDKVRLIVGKAEDKFVDGRSKVGGWKVHEVTSLDMERNKLMLKDVTYKKANPILPNPENFATLNEEDQKRFTEQQNFLNISRPIHYSNVQLCVEERDPIEGGSVFATRIATSPPIYDKLRRRLIVQRHAANTSERTGRREIAQPSWKIRNPEEPQINLDTPAIVATEETRSLIDPVSLWETKANGIPLAKSIRAPTSSLPRGISDNYIDGERDPTVDTLMPLYLSEELSPRFSRAKATKGWNLRREQEEEEREAFVKAKLSEWHAKGKDTGLENAMKTMGMSGKVRGRTADEVREMARVDYNQSVEERSKLARQAKRVGARYDVDADKWMVQLTGSKMTRKAKRERRAAKREDKLTQLVL